MAEYIRTIEVVFTVDTNKKTVTVRRSLDNIRDLPFEAENMAIEMREKLDI